MNRLLFFATVLASSAHVSGNVSGNDGDLEFNNDRQLVEEETGGILQLQSHGKLTKIVDLDEAPCIKRILCRGNSIYVALNTTDGAVPAIQWQDGQLVVSKRWQCNYKVTTPESYTVYAIVEAVKQPKDYFVELVAREAGPLDMLEEASVTVHYQQGPKPLRRKRFISKALDAIDWKASFVSDIPFNEVETEAEKPISLYKQKGVADAELDTEKDVPFTNSTHFLFRCRACHGHSQISYVFELKVKKVDKKPQVLKYMMHLEVASTIEQRLSMDVADEISLTKTGTLWQEGPTTIFETNLIEFKKLEPVVLRVTSSGQANLEMMAKMREETHYSVDFTASGNTVITQTFENGEPTVNEISTYNWTVVNNAEHLEAYRNVNATFAVFQNMTIAPKISWAQKDVDFNLGPPIKLSIRPKINLLSTTDGTKRCASSSIVVDSNVTVAETDFSFDAWEYKGFHNWSVVLMQRLSAERLTVLNQTMLSQCRADCKGQVVHDVRTTTEACGEPGERIVRGDNNFNQRLEQLVGDYILFASEEAISSSWCGSHGKPCQPCLTKATEDITNACADRLVNSDLATSLTRLAKFVEAEWGSRKVLVANAWDEPTSLFPNGKHGENSIYNEGRAADIDLTTPNPDTSSLQSIAIEMDNNIITRFHELATCSNFQHVNPKSGENALRVCVGKKPATHLQKRALLSRTRRSGDVHQPSVRAILETVGSAIEGVLSEVTPPAGLSQGASYPADKTMEQVCGEGTGIVSQDNVERMKRLVEYPLDNIEFLPEGPSDTWCGVETRRCRSCASSVEDKYGSEYVTDTWNWCGTRTMSMRMAVRLQRLAVLTNNKISVTKPQVTGATDADILELFEEGRAVLIEPIPGLTMAELTSWAKFAGFDYVRFMSPTFIEVCVKPQDGLNAQAVMFPMSTLTAVPTPLDDEYEYAYPSEHVHEMRRPLLFDVSTTTNELSEHFKVRDFQYPGAKYLRIDTHLVELLELAYDDFPDGFHIIRGSAYRPRSVTLDNVEGRHEKERFRFQMGQAVELKPNGLVNCDTLFALGISLMKAGRTVQQQRLGIGIGTKRDRLYFQVWSMALNESSPVFWDSGNALLFEKFKMVQDQIKKGGFIISAKSDREACATPVLGKKYFYFNFDLEEEGDCSTTPEQEAFCTESEDARREHSEAFMTNLISAAGRDQLKRSDIEPDIEDCLIKPCGGCSEAGKLWNDKVVACTKLIQNYIAHASVPFQPLRDRVSIFNTENLKSTVHGEACAEPRVCLENTQIHSFLEHLLLESKYYHEKSPEAVFGVDNPSPLFDIVEQELAYRAEGHVDVFIDGTKDIFALSNALKIIMMYNKNVTDVTYRIDPAVNKIDVTTSLQEKLEEWSTSVCPHWSRIAVTPYKVEVISHERKKRSVENSEGRNQKMHRMKRFEVEWLLKA